MTNPLLELKALGQSVWLDDIDREQLLSGQFQHLIVEPATVSSLLLFPLLPGIL